MQDGAAEPKGARAGGISVIVPVLNDRDELAVLLPALAGQERAPDEVVVVDGGSTDGTLELLAEWRERLPLRVISDPGNISSARNAGVRAAANEWVACTDAGCVPEPGWLAAIDDARSRADFVAGLYRVVGDTDFARALAVSLYPVPEEIDSPSAARKLWQRLFGKRWEATAATGRSMAFTHAAWEAAGGFPEDLYAGEDTAFSAAVVASGARTELVGRAVVEWRPRPTLGSNARMYATYARGDVRRGYRRHLVRLAAWTAMPALAIFGEAPGRAVALTWALAYASLPLERAVRRGYGVGVIWRVPAVIAMKDLAQIAGAAQGLRDEARGVPQARPGG